MRANWIRQIRSQAGGTISLLVLAIGGGALALALAAEWAGLRFNDSPSMPTGLYVRTSSDRIIHMLETGVALWQKIRPMLGLSRDTSSGRHQRPFYIFDASPGLYSVDVIHDRRISFAAEVVGRLLDGLRTCHL